MHKAVLPWHGCISRKMHAIAPVAGSAECWVVVGCCGICTMHVTATQPATQPPCPIINLGTWWYTHVRSQLHVYVYCPHTGRTRTPARTCNSISFFSL